MDIILKGKKVSTDYIALKTGKRKADIHQDIKKMLSNIDGGKIHHDEYQVIKDKRGYIKEYLLNERLFLLLISRYNDNLRLAIIDDWIRLKTQEMKHLKNVNKSQQSAIDEFIEQRDKNRWWMND